MPLPTDFRAYMFLQEQCQHTTKSTQVLVCCDSPLSIYSKKVDPKCLNTQGRLFFNELQRKFEDQNYDAIISKGGERPVGIQSNHQSGTSYDNNMLISITFDDDSDYDFHYYPGLVVFLTDNWVYTLDNKLFKIKKG